MFLFLTNANSKLGFGHLRRCEYLKKELDKKKIKSYILNDSKRIIPKEINANKGPKSAILLYP